MELQVENQQHYEVKEICEALRVWDVSKINTMINNGVALNLFHIPKRTDILLETIVRANLIMFKKVLAKGFSVEQGEFLYLHHAVRTNDWLFCQGIILNVVAKKEYVNRIDKISGNNVLHVGLNKKVRQKLIRGLSLNGVAWSTQNSSGNTPLHILFQNYQIIDTRLTDNLAEKMDLPLDVKNNIGVTPRDILKMHAKNIEWISEENNQYLLHKLDIL
jgi:hypothetical protein